MPAPRSIALLGLAAAAAAYQHPLRPSRRTGVIAHGGRLATPLGRTKTPAGKAATVASVKEDLENSFLAFSVDGSGVEVSVIDDLRRRLPEAAKARTVKNTLMRRAALESGMLEAAVDGAPPLVNTWIFAPQDDVKETVKAYEAWVKDNGLDKPVKAGFFEGDLLDAAGVQQVKDLPTMPELMLKLCVSLNLAGSLGIAKAVKAAKGNPRQVAVAVSKIEKLPFEG
mmetsp:Transcript_26508/g.79486  ORF Transcript_26508/g.79486 Transcript_26508/m.79486 type:complete len:226 (-) Transcript_26508:40-717(-)